MKEKNELHREAAGMLLRIGVFIVYYILLILIGIAAVVATIALCTHIFPIVSKLSFPPLLQPFFSHVIDEVDADRLKCTGKEKNPFTVENARTEDEYRAAIVRREIAMAALSLYESEEKRKECRPTNASPTA